MSHNKLFAVISLVGVIFVGLASANEEMNKLYESIYAETGEPMGDEMTLKSMNQLKEAYENLLNGKLQTDSEFHEDDIADELKELNTMIGLRSAGVSQCGRDYFKSISYIIYANKASTVNLVPYLQHHRLELYKKCAQILAKEESQTMSKVSSLNEINMLNGALSKRSTGGINLDASLIAKGVADYMNNHYSITALKEIVEGDQDTYEIFFNEDVILPCQELLEAMQPLCKIYHIYEHALVPNLILETKEHCMKVERCQMISDNAESVSRTSLAELKNVVV